jgi:hypothetical protein
MKQEGLVLENLPERLMEEYLSHHWRALGRTTRQQKSRSLRKVSGHESFAAQHPSACCTDITRGDNLIWDPIQDRPVSVEIGSMMSISARVVTAMRIFPRSANGVDVGAAALRHHAAALHARRELPPTAQPSTTGAGSESPNPWTSTLTPSEPAVAGRPSRSSPSGASTATPA